MKHTLQLKQAPQFLQMCLKLLWSAWSATVERRTHGLAAGFRSPLLWSTQDLGYCLSSWNSWITSWLLLTPVFGGLTVHFNLIHWCFKCLMLFVLCCVNVNVWSFQTQAAASVFTSLPGSCWSLWHLSGMFWPLPDHTETLLPFSGALQQVVCPVTLWPCTGVLLHGYVKTNLRGLHLVWTGKSWDCWVSRMAL